MTAADRAEQQPDSTLDRLRRQKASLFEFGRLALQDVPLDALLQDAAARAAEGTGIDHAKVLVYDPARGDFLIRAGVGWDEGVVGRMRIPAGERSPPGRAFLTGEPVIVEDLPNDPDFDAHEPLKSYGIVSLVNVPIRTDEATYGVLEVDADEKVEFGDDDIDFLHGFANLVAAAVERKSAEEATRVTAGALARAAAERQVLLRELQHRVANNFQALLGAVYQVHNKAQSEEAKTIARALMERVDGMARAHELLSINQLPRAMMLGSYLASLCSSITKHHPRVRLETDLREAEIPLDRAVAVGLILNELIVNALKHAFPGEACGTIRVELTPDLDRGDATLVVLDTGRGMGPPRKGSSGLGLLSSLAEQIGGRIQRSDNLGGGTRYELQFPLAPA